PRPCSNWPKRVTGPCVCSEWQNDDKNFWLMYSEITEITETKEERSPRQDHICPTTRHETPWRGDETLAPQTNHSFRAWKIEIVITLHVICRRGDDARAGLR